MKLSTKGRYGLKAMYDLADHYGEGPISLSSISKRQDISLSYLEQLISTLRKDNLVISIRGAQGGYKLISEPKKITVGEVLTALEGQLVPVSCVSSDKNVHCNKSSECVTHKIWEKIHESIEIVVGSITLQDMLNDNYNVSDIKVVKKGVE